MTVPNIFVGGTKAKASEVNENFAFVIMHRKLFTDVTERTETLTAFTDTATTFALTAPVNAMIIGITVKAELNHDNAGDLVEASLKINGTNLGTVFLSNRNNTILAKHGGINHTDATPYIDTSEARLMGNQTGTAYAFFFGQAFSPLKVLDASTTFTMRLRSVNGLGTVRMRNVTIEVLYIEGFTED